MARRFLHELESFSLSPEMRLGAQILKARVIMATSKSDIDRAMQILLEVIQTDQNCVPAIFGISMGFLMEGSIAKARNALKRIAKLPHSHGWIRELERSYLFLADIYIRRSKFDLAEDLCQRCLTYNVSCCKAWDLIGLVREKEAVAS
mmetsp:Transcript_22606/g.70743  ORF Transcript_22606/g.70743 Transcript_22606/m.70743 type:complete len:148 (+) Transcript_22606:3494-3937(+)